jgi:hypothetical protein
LDGETKQVAEENASFFSSVEGLFSLSQDDAIEGLYITTEPKLKVARIPA